MVDEPKVQSGEEEEYEQPEVITYQQEEVVQGSGTYGKCMCSHAGQTPY